MASLSIENLEKTYPNGFHALKGISVKIADGELLVVVGPSGCGKSTLLRCVAGLERVSSGSLLLDGAPVTDLRPDARDIAMVFQNYALYPHMNVFNNLAYGLRNRKVPIDQIKSQIMETAEVLHISELLERQPAQLSGGQRQRVAMGRAIVRKPKVFLFDEPLSNLDAKLRAHMRVEIKRLQKKQQVTTMFVTHDQVEAMTLGDRVMLLNDGKVEQLGTPEEMFYKPNSTYVASFIGSPSINILPARVAGGTVSLANAEAQQSLAAPGVADGEVQLGVRPQDMQLVEASESHIALNVDVVEQLGDLMLLHGKVGSHDLTVQLATRSCRVASGEKVRLRIDGDAMHFFKSDGKRI